MGIEPVVVLRAGVPSFFFGPVAFCIAVSVLLDADPGDATVDEVSLNWGLVCGGLISLVLLGGFDAADALLVLACLDGRLDSLAVYGVSYSNSSGDNLAFWEGWLFFSRPLRPSLEALGCLEPALCGSLFLCVSFVTVVACRWPPILENFSRFLLAPRLALLTRPALPFPSLDGLDRTSDGRVLSEITGLPVGFTMTWGLCPCSGVAVDLELGIGQVLACPGEMVPG